MHFKR